MFGMSNESDRYGRLVGGLEPSDHGGRRDGATLHDVLETAATRWAATDTPLVVLVRR